MLNNFYIQKNLKSLNYYKGNIDEIIGPQTKQAIKDFQKDFNLMIDGMWGNETESKYQAMNGIKHFNLHEFKCNCGCGETRIDIRLVKILDEIRDYYGKPLIVTSGVRCPKHNKEVGGVSTSWHLSTRGGKASDFYVEGVNVTELLSHCIDLRNQGKIRYTYTNNTSMNGVVHIDIGGIR